MNIKQKWQSLKTWKKTLIISLVCLTIIGRIIPKQEPKVPPVITPWAKMSKQEQIEWRKNLLDVVDHNKFSYDIELAVKNMTKFPLETDVNISEGIYNRSRASSTEPTVEYVGTGKTKNAFGVKVAFRWRAVVSYKPEGSRIESIEVK